MEKHDVRAEVTDRYSLRGRVLHRLRENILSGIYKDGEELREITLGKELGVSRTPVREALRQLELEGLVRIIPNRGAYVNGISAKDVEDIYMIRSRLEGLCARWACANITEAQLQEMEDVLDLADKRQERGQNDQLAELDNHFHRILYESAHSKMLENILKDYHAYVLRIRKRTLTGSRGKVSNEEHRAILSAIRDRDPDRAEEAANRHILSAFDNMVKNGLYEVYEKKETENKEQ